MHYFNKKRKWGRRGKKEELYYYQRNLSCWSINHDFHWNSTHRLYVSIVVCAIVYLPPFTFHSWFVYLWFLTLSYCLSDNFETKAILNCLISFFETKSSYRISFSIWFMIANSKYCHSEFWLLVACALCAWVVHVVKYSFI